ncbi:GPI ethanolamine phosphate transferase 3-like [Patiria miniata]|uniref:GPI ethanolamine phosphate transferase 3, catalytic subunit n=1 Tax=Patiria miniata TaxID=46514 RepID=A0A914B9F1_PATMI|nr:GPI ethanolamine phosphate transferase 3-like [Patiria miniata]
MSIGTKLFMLLIWIGTLFGIGIMIFSRGFLLNRLEIQQKSYCTGDSDHSGESIEGARQSCGEHRRYSKAIIIVIDALRYDFTLYNETLDNKSALPFQNKLPFLHKLRSEKPQHSLLYEFIADPPTTTMQRLKGLTTGSLPTFVDAGSNFASAEITEDSFIHQLHRLGKRITFMGDNTWESLFKGQFSRSFPFPSFNVKDLHTVDNGVIEHLVPEMAEQDWDLIVAHFLGVDHCGHRFGPFHSAMGEKLLQMDQVLRSVVERLDDDTVLFVLGDHGMTRTGDHGGDSREEVAAALFVYSHSILHQETPDMKSVQVASQIDLVPTLSLLLGVPVPFSNLGSIIPELFTLTPFSNQPSSPAIKNWPLHVQSVYNKVGALRTNAHQVNHYLQAYSKISDEFPRAQFALLQDFFQDAETAVKEVLQSSANDEIRSYALLQRSEQVYLQYLNRVKEMCRSMWARFDLTLIILGLAIVVGTCLTSYVLLTHNQNFGNRVLLDSALGTLLKIIAVTIIACLLIGLIISFTIPGLQAHSAILVLTIPAVGSLLNAVVWIAFVSTEMKISYLFKFLTYSIKTVMAVILTLTYAACLTSNSFVINEGYVAAFLTHSLHLVCMCSVGSIFIQSKSSKETTRKKTKTEKSRDIGHFLTNPGTVFALLVFAFHLCVRFSSLFLACREEQNPCQQSELLRPLGTFSDDTGSYRNYRYLMSVASLAFIPASLTFWLNKQGNLNGGAAPVFSVVYALPIATVCICLNWGLQALPQKVLDNLPAWQQVLMPRLAYVMLFVAFITILWNPLCIYLVPREETKKKIQVDYPGEGESVVPKLFNHLKTTWKRNTRQGKLASDDSQDEIRETSPPVVYGLATVFSACWLLLSASVALLIALLLGDGLAPAVLTMILQMIIYLELYAIIRRQQLAPLEVVPDLHHLGMYQVPWYAIATWGFMSSQFFFATGHHATISSIRFDSAFTGFHGDFPPYLYFIPGALITINTFASQIVFAVALPLLLIWPFTRGKMIDRKKDEDRKGELGLHVSNRELRIAFFQIILAYILYNATQLVGAMVSAAIHRRHLMVWKIFAPRFVFQGVSFMVVMVILILLYLLLVKIDRAVSNWLQVLFQDV